MSGKDIDFKKTEKSGKIETTSENEKPKLVTVLKGNTSYNGGQSTDNRSETNNSTLKLLITKRLQSGVTSQFAAWLWHAFLCLKLHTIGVFFATSGIYTIVGGIIRAVVEGSDQLTSRYLIGAIMFLCSIPMMASRDTLITALNRSAVGEHIVKYLGLRNEEIVSHDAYGQSNLSFLLGIVFGILAYFEAPLHLLAAIGILVLALSVIDIPETGIVLMFLFALFTSAYFVEAIMLLTLVSFLFKFIQSRRLMNYERFDMVVVALLIVFICGGITPYSNGSFRTSLMWMGAAIAYLCIVAMINSRLWLDRCTLALVFSGVVYASLIIVSAIMKDLAYNGTIFSMFADSLSSFDPSVQNNYIIMAFLAPFALAISTSTMRTNVRRVSFALSLFAFVCVAISGNIGAVVATAISLFIVSFLKGKKGVYIAVSVVSAAVLLYNVALYIFSNISYTLTDLFGNYISTRIESWRESLFSLRETLFFGAGFNSWSEFGANAGHASDAYSTYISLIFEIGIFGTLLLLIFFIGLLVYNISFFSDVNRSIAPLGTRIYKPSRNALILNSSPDEQDDVSLKGYRVSLGLKGSAAAPLCGIISLLLLGFTENILSSGTIVVLLWLGAGLSMAYVRVGRDEIRKSINAQGMMARPHRASLDIISVGKRNKRKRENI